MTKKKPDFLRDLDTAIMDELTGGGIKGNAAGLVGTLTQIKEIKQLCGLPFCGYMAKLETVRPSGVPDEVTVVFAEDVPYRACNCWDGIRAASMKRCLMQPQEKENSAQLMRYRYG